jgi:aspartate/methionine/tyrosine aminotransferase
MLTKDPSSTPEPMLLSERTRQLIPSKIREVAELGIGRPDVLPLWFGETQWPTASYVVEAATQALRHADHFYQPNSGKMALRQAICAYHQQILGINLPTSRITVTASGMQGIALTAQALISPGDQVISIEPCWPNIGQSFQSCGAHLIRVDLQERDQKWHLDIEQVLNVLREKPIKAILINSPNNPTGWVMSAEQQKALLQTCRKHGTWIIADDVYARLMIDAPHAPTFLSLADEDDRIISINSFSKAWNMTGWRLGWIVAPKQLENPLAMLTEFNIAGPAGFVQQAGIAALEQGEADIASLNQKLAQAFNFIDQALSQITQVKYIRPEGAFYCFFGIQGMSDSLQFSKNLLAQQRLGLAPGIAFGSAGEGYLRMCYARSVPVLDDAIQRLNAFLKGMSK